MKTYTRDELQEILSKHIKWLKCEDGGERANLSWADLSRANLVGANLSFAFVACITGKKLYQTSGGIGECGRSLTLLAEGEEDKWLWWIGCFNGKSEEALREEIESRHIRNEKARITMCLAIDYLKAIAKENSK